MKKLVTSVMILALASVVFVGSAAAFEGSADSYIGVYSKYLWRGVDVNPDDDFVVQAGSDISFGNFTVSWWANANDEIDVDEVDIVLDYSFDVNELVSVSVGNILYEIIFSGKNVNEFSINDNEKEKLNNVIECKNNYCSELLTNDEIEDCIWNGCENIVEVCWGI